MAVKSRESETYEMLMKSAERIGKLAEKEALEADKHATISKNVVNLIKEERINQLIKPKIYEGPQIDFTTFTDMIQKVGYHNMSAAWLTYFFALHNCWATALPKHSMDKVYANNALLADIFAPVGRTEKVEGGYMLSGKWDFVSGINHSDWVAVAAMHMREEGAAPERIGLVVKVEDLEIIENWNPLGLRGSGSNSIRIQDMFIPEDMTFKFEEIDSKEAFNEAIDEDYLYYKPPFMSAFFVGFSAIAIGGAERTIHEFKEHVTQTSRVDGSLKAENPKYQRTLAKLELNFQTSKSLQRAYIELITENIDEYTPAKAHALRAKIVQLCTDTAITATQVLGAFVAIKGHPIEMITRDTINLSTHMTSLYEDALENYGKSELGLPAKTLG